MNLTGARDKWIVAALPAAITLFLGWMIFIRPGSRDVGMLQQRVQTMEAQSSLDTRKNSIARATADRMELEKAIAARRGASSGEASVFDRNWAMQQVSLLCAAHDVSLNKSEPEPNAKLPVALQESIAALARAGTVPQIWRIEMGGSYPRVMKVLDGLKKATPLIVPLNLSMQAGRNERFPATWVLTLWL